MVIELIGGIIKDNENERKWKIIASKLERNFNEKDDGGKTMLPSVHSAIEMR